MHPAPIKLTSQQLAKTAPTAEYVKTLASGERIYTDKDGNIYAVQPTHRNG